MQQAQKLDTFSLWLHSVHNNKRGAAYDQFAGALFAPSAAHFRVFDQLAHLVSYTVALLNGGLDAVLGDVIQLRVPVSNRPA